MPRHETLKQIARLAPVRMLKMAITLLVIAFLAQFLLIMADRGRSGLPAAPETAFVEAVSQTAGYVFNHPGTYYLRKANLPTTEVVLDAFSKSVGLLLFSLSLATLIGVPLGVSMALSRRSISRVLMLLTSVLLTSIPSFLLAMLLWIINIQIHQRLNTPQLPITGFGWDAHIVLPALVLMARPLAQIAQVTYVTMQDVMRQDFVRVAYAKGFSRLSVVDRHALKNTAIPVMTTLGASLRFSLASLPVVEAFFLWPGVGLLLLEAIRLGYNALVVDLIVLLGFLFLLLNLLLDFVYPVIDPRLRETAETARQDDHPAWRDQLRDWARAMKDGWAGTVDRLRRVTRRKKPALPRRPRRQHSAALEDERGAARSPFWKWRLMVRNGPLLIGLVLLSIMVVLVLWGNQLTINNPYQTHGVLMIDGKIAAPPFKPAEKFPWGSDVVGRDIQALVLWGARQTLALAFFSMVARILLGTLLGAVAGWTQNSKFDRLVTGGIDVWAAFPVTIFAMLLIQAIGIQQGTWVFIVSLALVGWGEVAQFVRSKVIAIKPQPYIEAAKSIGVQSGRMLSRHVFPNLLSSLVVLAALEMGSVLMLLAELGFLNIFLGGGFKAMIGEVGRMVPVIYYFSDVPEWGALLANIRDWWRSYPWMVWYAGAAFFLAIMTFNLLAEGLRRFLDESRVNVGRVINRYTALAVIAASLVWMLLVTAPVNQYTEMALQFDAQRAMQDISFLSARELAGRETGTAGAKAASLYIEQRMKQIGLQPAGTDPGYIQESPCPRFHLTEIPALEILDRQGTVAQTLRYREDFAEFVGFAMDMYTTIGFVRETFGENTGPIIGVAFGPAPDTAGRATPDKPGSDPYGLRRMGLDDKFVVVRESQLENLNTLFTGGTLVVVDDPGALQRKFLYRQERSSFTRAPVAYITPEVADQLLKTAGSSLADLDRKTHELAVGTVGLTDTGVDVHLNIAAQGRDDEMCYNVIGFIPGTGAEIRKQGEDRGLDRQVILISAYYDGLGTGPDGSFYPGANDNASGVAAMLEMARELKESPYAPKKTIVFAAWSGGERNQEFSVTNIMSAKKGFNLLTVEAVLELSGMGAGTGDAIELSEGSSYRLVQLFQTAASRLGNAVTTRGRDPHFGIPAQAGFGGRSGLTLNVSWDGSDATAHTALDIIVAIDLEKLRKSGQTTLLTLMVLSRETDY